MEFESMGAERKERGQASREPIMVAVLTSTRGLRVYPVWGLSTLRLAVYPRRDGSGIDPQTLLRLSCTLLESLKLKIVFQGLLPFLRVNVLEPGTSVHGIIPFGPSSSLIPPRELRTQTRDIMSYYAL